MTRQIYITENDYVKLKELIHTALREGLPSDNSFTALNLEIDKAKIIDGMQLPKDVVSMNSKVLIDMSNSEEEITLVYPQEADLTENRISVLSPIGTAILGYREGDRIDWVVPSGKTEIHIKKVLYQPEAEGDLHL